MESGFFYNPLFMTGVWCAIFVSDWMMNYSRTRLYFKQTREFLVYESSGHLRQISEADLASPMKLIPRFFSELLITGVGIWFMLYSARLYSSVDTYHFICGFFIILESCAHFRHLGNVAFFSSIKRGSGIKGQVLIPRWITLRSAGVDFAIFSVAFLLVFLVNSDNTFLLGGVFSCAITSFFNLFFALIERRRSLAGVNAYNAMTAA